MRLSSYIKSVTFSLFKNLKIKISTCFFFYKHFINILSTVLLTTFCFIFQEKLRNF